MAGSGVGGVRRACGSGVSNQDGGGRWVWASPDRDEKRVSKSRSGSNDTLSRANVSKSTSEGFFRRTKWEERAGGRSDQADGGLDNDGLGGTRDGKVTGMGRDGGCLSFLESCWPARRPPARREAHQRSPRWVHGARMAKRVR